MEEVLEVVLYIFFILSAIILTLLCLFRQGDSSGGLGGAFGGMGGDTAFGVKTAQLIDKIIVWVTVVFVLAAVFYATLKHHQKSAISDDDDTTGQVELVDENVDV